MAAENDISETTDDNVAFEQDNDTTCPVPDASRNGKLNISTSDEKPPLKFTNLKIKITSKNISSFSLQRPFPLLNKTWYKGRGKLAAKNIAREKQNSRKKEVFLNNTRAGVDFHLCSGSLSDNI